MNRDIDELVQVAAVAVAIMEDDEFGQCDAQRHNPNEWTQLEEIVERIGVERIRQDEQWGARHLTKLEWAMILAEEIGEWANEMMKLEGTTSDPDAVLVLEMLGQVESVARWWIKDHEWESGKLDG